MLAHNGESAESGHYIAYKFVDWKGKKSWVKVDDEICTFLRPSDSSEVYKSQDCIMLFYENVN